MKRFFSLLLILAVLFLAAGCSQTEKEAVLPPIRIGTRGTSQASLNKIYTVETAFAAADAVARIEVGNWLGDNCDRRKAYFEATVLQTFKGDMPETFTLLQHGDTQITIAGYPLFASGNELLLFLKKAVDTTYEDGYWILGAYSTTVDVCYDTEGNRYYADRYGILCQDFSGCADYAMDMQVVKELRSYLAEIDPFSETMGYIYPHIYLASDLEAFMEGL